MKISYTNGPNR